MSDLFDPWAEIMNADRTRPAPAAATVAAPASGPHPFAHLGPGPYSLVSTGEGESACAHCGTRIKNIYVIETANGSRHEVGSDCVLKIGERSAALVFEVKQYKRERDRQKRAARKIAARAEAAAHALEIFKSEAPDVVEFLTSYEGSFGFYLSLKASLAEWGSLTEHQLSSLRACMARDAERKLAAPTPREFGIKPGQVLVVKKWLARRYSQDAGVVGAHYAFDVVSVEAESAKAYKAVLKCSGRRTSYCSRCGRHLENAESVAAGIGPICAEKLGIDIHGLEPLEQLKARLATTQEISVWVPKSQIEAIENEVQS